jgi:hypothetical protein
LALGLATAASAHHSFQAFFQPDGNVSATGVVTRFNFANPHATIEIQANDAQGQAILWRGETNSPSLLRRRGWSQASLTIGETITMEGWPSRDGTRYMRIRTVRRADGSLVGAAPFTPKDEDSDKKDGK